MNLATIIVLLVVLALVVVVINTLRKGKGNCSCGEYGKNTRNGKCASCTADCPLKGK